MSSNALPFTKDAPPPMRMMEMLYGALATQMISVAAGLGVADLLADGPKPVTELIDLITTQRAFELNSQVVQAGAPQGPGAGVIASSTIITADQSSPLRIGAVPDMWLITLAPGSAER